MSILGSVIGGVGSIAGGILGSKSGNKLQRPPEYLARGTEQLAKWGQQLAQTPYTGYTGNRVAPFSQDTLDAFNMIRNNVGTAQPYYANALQTAERLQNTTINPQQVTAAQFAGTDLSPYLNPYTNEVVDASLADLENQRALQYNNLASQAQAAGAFGGTRFGVAQGQFEADALRNKSLLAAQLRNQGFETAANLAMQDVGARNVASLANQQADLQGQISTADIQNRNAFLSGVLAREMQGGQIADAQALAGAGAAQQAMTQQGLDIDYQDFLEQRDWGQRQMGLWQQALSPALQQYAIRNGTPAQSGGGLLGAIGGAQLGAQVANSIYDWWKGMRTPAYSSYDITSEYDKG